jgi:hypothetical protein
MDLGVPKSMEQAVAASIRRQIGDCKLGTILTSTSFGVRTSVDSVVCSVVSALILLWRDFSLARRRPSASKCADLTRPTRCASHGDTRELDTRAVPTAETRRAGAGSSGCTRSQKLAELRLVASAVCTFNSCICIYSMITAKNISGGPS